MGPGMGMIFGLGLVVWVLVEPQSFMDVFGRISATFIELVKTLADTLEQQSAKP